VTLTPALPATLSPRSRSAYEREIALYEDWCARGGLAPWPCSEEQLVAYARWLATEWRSPLDASLRRHRTRPGKAVPSVERAIFVIGAMHGHAGLPAPSTARAMDAAEKYGR
jgi:hypothetical protein